MQKQPCLGGTYNPDKIGHGPADCVSCPPGYYCEGSTSTAPTGLCEAGYICPGGASNPRQQRAPKGHFAAEGAAKATPCPKGSFNPNEAQAECTLCLAGYAPDRVYRHLMLLEDSRRPPRKSIVETDKRIHIRYCKAAAFFFIAAAPADASSSNSTCSCKQQQQLLLLLLPCAIVRRDTKCVSVMCVSAASTALKKDRRHLWNALRALIARRVR